MGAETQLETVIDRTLFVRLSLRAASDYLVRRNPGRILAVFGSALTALTLTGSTQLPANYPIRIPDTSAFAELKRSKVSGHVNFRKGNYLEARADFLWTASLSVQSNRTDLAATAFGDAGASALARQDFRDALADFLKASEAARDSRKFVILARTSNNLASLYLQMSNPEVAMQVASEGLALSAAIPDHSIRPKLRFQLASALARLHRFDEARPIYRLAINEMYEQGDVDATARALSGLGGAALDAGFIAEADAAMTEALRIVRIHRLASANVLRGLARVKDREGDLRSAAALFDAAVAAPPGLTPRWAIYADRGDFRLARNDLRGALADFRAADRFVSLMRADIVPADQDRIALESGLSRVADGLVEAGNRLALQTSDQSFLRETFNAASQDRLWSLRALTPAPNDWRTRLPQNYWDLLTRYQSAERAVLAESPADSSARPGNSVKTAALQLELQQIEATAGAIRGGDPQTGQPVAAVSPLNRAQSLLDSDSVLLSFHLSASAGWVWAVDRNHVDVYRTPPLIPIKAAVAAFTQALRSENPAAADLGRNLYKQLLGSVSPSYLAHKRWLLELDGPLFDLPFAALIINETTNQTTEETGENDSRHPIYLAQRAALEAIPSVLLPRAENPDKDSGEMLGIGDPVYNAADSRYAGSRIAGAGIALPRLIATAAELEACSRAWGVTRTRIISGSGASLAGVESALLANPSVIHFATHVVAGPADHSSGLIALSLESSGAMGLMGPTEIVARPVTARLVVLNGCYSARGDALPGAGLMGLTRAWIGAGAGAVLATRWNIPDDAGQNLMAAFYRHLRSSWARGPAFALQEAQLELLKNNPALNKSDLLGAYFLLGRI